jgi:putative endonuclease
MRAKDGLGRYGENVAARYLGELGYELLARNWRCPQGELDIVARDDRTLVFVEVKTRSSVEFGTPAEAVTRVKAQRLRVLAAAWLAQHRPPYGELRFDVISVLRQPAGAARVEHLRGAIS